MKVVVFDLYNTLVKIDHNQYFFRKIYKESSNRFGLSNQAYKKALLTNRLEDLFIQLPADFQQIYDSNKQILDEELNSISTFPHTIEVLWELSQKYQLFLISNLSTPYKRPYTKLGLDRFFEKAIFSCDHGLMKPQREIFQLVEQYSGISKAEIMMIGDSQASDINGAKRVGWKYLKINRKAAKLRKYEIASLVEVLEKL